MDFAAFREEHPDLCGEGDLPAPGLDDPPGGSGEPVADWQQAHEAVDASRLWEDPPVVRRLMGEAGAEAFGFYRTFRVDPKGWGLYLRGRPLVGLAKEVLRVLTLGFIELKEVEESLARRLAFSMAFDVVSNHLAFHAAVDMFAAEREVAAGEAYYAPYLQGPYAESLGAEEDEEAINLEEVLANVVSLRSFLNPNMAVELGGLVNEALDEEGQYRWNAYLMSGNLTTELTYIFRAYPPSYRPFIRFLRRRGEVGPYAHMAIQYDLDTEAFNEALQDLARILLGDGEVEGAEKELLKPLPLATYLLDTG